MNQRTDNIFRTKEITYCHTNKHWKDMFIFFTQTNCNLKKEFNPPHQNLYIVKIKKKMRILKNMQVYPL